MPTATQQQIATKLGVTRVLVSRALSGHPSVAPATRERIQQVALEMGYTQSSNREARLMAGKRHGRRQLKGIIGCANFVLASRRQVPYWELLLAGIESEAHRAGFDVLLMRAFTRTECEKVDGVLVHGDKGWIEPLSGGAENGIGVPLMAVMESSAPSAVLADDELGGRLAASHLLDLGHRRIGCLMFVESPIIKRRLTGFRAAMDQAGAELRPDWVRDLNLKLTSTSTADLGRVNMEKWLSEGWAASGCTAILAQNDEVAQGILEALKTAGLSVPGDVSVVGFDGTELGAHTLPALTSVAVPLEQIGQVAARSLIERIQRENSEEEDADEIFATADRGALTAPLILPVTLQIRDSTGQPRAA